MPRLCLAALLIACFSTPATAYAWTSAKVRDVRAEVLVDPHGSAQVSLDIGVEVLGGWLERFDLDGFEEDLTLAEMGAASLTTDEGVVIPARAESDGSAITLRFDKHQAARRGLHRIAVRYVAPLQMQALSGDSSRMQVTWLLPAWEHGLARAEITVRGPKTLVATRDPLEAVQLTQRLVNGQSEMTFVRVLVPRSTAWSVAVEGPMRLFSSDRPRTTATVNTQAKALSWPVSVAVTVFVWLTSVLARLTFRRKSRALFVRAVPWLRSKGMGRSLSVLFAGIAVWGGVRGSLVMVAALLALVACFADRVDMAPRSVPLGRFRPIGKVERSQARLRWLRERVGFLDFTDVGTVLGGLTASALLAFAVQHAARDLTLSLGLMCALPLWASSSRLRLPRGTDEQIAVLLQAARNALALSCGMRLVGFAVGDGQLTSPRIRISTSTRFSGLLRLDVAVDARRQASPLVLIAVTQADSLADRALQQAFGVQGRELSPRGNRAAYVQPIDELGAGLEQVLSTLAAYAQRTVERAETKRAA